MAIVDAQLLTGTDGDANFRYNTGNAEYAQGFVPNYSGKVTSISLLMKKEGSPTGNAYVQLQEDNAGVPSNTSLVQSGNVDVSTLTGTYAWITFTFASPIRVSAGKQYHFVLFATTTFSTTNWIRVQCSTTGGYPRGVFKNRYDGAAWADDYGGDLYFKESVEPEANSFLLGML